MHALCANHFLRRQPELDRMKQERERLGAAEPAVRSDELLEGCDFVAVAPVGAVEDDVRAVRETVGALDVPGGVGPERR